jgi:hypothetical protein
VIGNAARRRHNALRTWEGRVVRVDDAGDPGPQPSALDASTVRVTHWRMWSLAGILGLAGLGGAALYIWITTNPVSTGSVGVGEVIILIAGFVTVTLLLYLGTLILRSLDLGAPAEALGMPQGSIRALIAMSLILVFAIVGFVVLKSGTGTPGQSHGVTQAQIDVLRADGAKITNQSLITAAPGQPEPSAGQERYDVATLQPLSADSHDFGLQLLSTVSTLVVAVAGFYFGAQSVSQATKTVQAFQVATQQPPPAPETTVVAALPEPSSADGAGAEDADEPPVAEVDTVADGADGADSTDDAGAADTSTASTAVPSEAEPAADDVVGAIEEGAAGAGEAGEGTAAVDGTTPKAPGEDA